MISIKKLLKVLDITENEQRIWILQQQLTGNCGCLGDLAFQLRDEAKDLPKFVWSKAWHLIVAKEMYYYNWSYEEWMQNFDEWSGTAYPIPNNSDRDIFALYRSKPIHWIIAALIAKELVKDNNDAQTK